MIDISFSELCYTESRKPCILPFSYEGVWYNRCTTIGDINEKPWCSTDTDGLGRHKPGSDSWGYCQIQTKSICLPQNTDVLKK